MEDTLSLRRRASREAESAQHGATLHVNQPGGNANDANLMRPQAQAAREARRTFRRLRRKVVVSAPALTTVLAEYQFLFMSIYLLSFYGNIINET